MDGRDIPQTCGSYLILIPYEESTVKAASFMVPVLITNLGLAPAIAAIIAALIIKTISSASAETICEVWKEKLATPGI